MVYRNYEYEMGFSQKGALVCVSMCCVSVVYMSEGWLVCSVLFQQLRLHLHVTTLQGGRKWEMDCNGTTLEKAQ